MPALDRGAAARAAHLSCFRTIGRPCLGSNSHWLRGTACGCWPPPEPAAWPAGAAACNGARGAASVQLTTRLARTQRRRPRQLAATSCAQRALLALVSCGPRRAGCGCLRLQGAQLSASSAAATRWLRHLQAAFTGSVRKSCYEEDSFPPVYRGGSSEAAQAQSCSCSWGQARKGSACCRPRRPARPAWKPQSCVPADSSCSCKLQLDSDGLSGGRNPAPGGAQGYTRSCAAVE